MKSKSPSFNGGMNSLPRFRTGIMVSARMISETPSTSHRARMTQSTTGRYKAMRMRLIGFRASGVIFPRMRKTIRTGTSVTERSAAKNIANVLVKASG